MQHWWHTMKFHELQERCSSPSIHYTRPAYLHTAITTICNRRTEKYSIIYYANHYHSHCDFHHSRYLHMHMKKVQIQLTTDESVYPIPLHPISRWVWGMAQADIFVEVVNVYASKTIWHISNHWPYIQQNWDLQAIWTPMIFQFCLHADVQHSYK